MPAVLGLVFIVIDNFGLFEAVVYKPEALIKNMEALALIETDDPYAIPLVSKILRGPSQSFHLVEHARNFGKAIQVHRRYGMRWDLGRDYLVLGDFYREQGKFNLARRLFEGAKGFFEERSNKVDTCVF